MKKRTCVRGTAVIDTLYNIKTANEEFYGFLGANGMFSLVKSIYPDDIVRIDKALRDIVKTPENIICVRMLRYDQKYRWVIMHLQMQEDSAENENNDCKEKNSEVFISVEIQDVSELKNTIDIIQQENDIYTEYFSLMDYMYIMYEKESDELRLSMIGSHQRITFYSGTLEGWRMSKMESGSVDVDSLERFEHLCRDIRNCRRSFEHDIKLKLLDENNKYELCRIKCKKIVDYNNQLRVVGIMSLVNEDRGGDNTGSILARGVRDAGTDLLNKRSITAYVQRLIGAKPDEKITMAIIDIDNFKDVNDSYGHMVGDEIISDVATVVKNAVVGRGVAGRIGGDELFIVLEDVGDNDDIRSVLRTIRNNVSFLYNGRDDRPHVTCSIGASTYPTDGDNYNDLFRIADKILYLAKEKGRNRYIIYHSDLHEDYIKGIGKAANDEKIFFKYRKIVVVNSIIKSFNSHKVNWDEICDKILLTFLLDSIYVYKRSDNGWHCIVLAGKGRDSAYNSDYLDYDNYLADFTEDNIKVIENIIFYERKAEHMYKAFSEMGISQGVQIIVNVHNTEYVVSFNRFKQLKKWEEKDIMYFSILANMIASEMDDEKREHYD